MYEKNSGKCFISQYLRYLCKQSQVYLKEKAKQSTFPLKYLKYNTPTRVLE